MAVHKDKDHIHCHLVTNSVSYEDGRKLHNTKKDLECMKQLTNQMCREHGLTVAEKGKHFDGSQIEKGEVIAWSKDKYKSVPSAGERQLCSGLCNGSVKSTGKLY